MFDELVVVFIQPILSTIGESLAFEADYHIQNSIRSDEAQSTKTCSVRSMRHLHNLCRLTSLFPFSCIRWFPLRGFLSLPRKNHPPPIIALCIFGADLVFLIGISRTGDLPRQSSRI